MKFTGRWCSSTKFSVIQGPKHSHWHLLNYLFPVPKISHFPFSLNENWLCLGDFPVAECLDNTSFPGLSAVLPSNLPALALLHQVFKLCENLHVPIDIYSSSFLCTNASLLFLSLPLTQLAVHGNWPHWWNSCNTSSKCFLLQFNSAWVALFPSCSGDNSIYHLILTSSLPNQSLWHKTWFPVSLAHIISDCARVSPHVPEWHGNTMPPWLVEVDVIQQEMELLH